MIAKHQELLAKIEECEAAAKALNASGCPVELTIHLLQQAGKPIRERIAHYKRKGSNK